MPTYDYQCKTCENRFERFQKMTDPAVTECPECGGPVRKVLHPPAIAFKGPGFYVNDYKGGSRGAGAKEADTTASPDKPTEVKAAPEPKQATEASKPGKTPESASPS
jgi:putative FmdB family regulatory protein